MQIDSLKKPATASPTADVREICSGIGWRAMLISRLILVLPGLLSPLGVQWLRASSTSAPMADWLALVQYSSNMI
jgi:hypothetical protein